MINLSINDKQAVHLMQFIRYQRAFTEEDIEQSIEEIYNLIVEATKEDL